MAQINSVSFNGTIYSVLYASGAVRDYKANEVPKTVLSWLVAQAEAVEEAEEAMVPAPVAPAPVAPVAPVAPAASAINLEVPSVSAPAPVAVAVEMPGVAPADVRLDFGLIAALVAGIRLLAKAAKAVWGLAKAYAPIIWAWICQYAPIVWGKACKAARISGRVARLLAVTAKEKAMEAWPYILAYSWTAYGFAVNTMVPALKAIGLGIGRMVVSMAAGIANGTQSLINKAVEAYKTWNAKRHELPMTKEPAIIGTYVPTWEACEW